MLLYLLISLIASKIKLPKFSQFLVGEGLDSKVLEESFKYLKKMLKRFANLIMMNMPKHLNMMINTTLIYA